MALVNVMEVSIPNNPAKFLILTGNIEFAENNLPDTLKSKSIIMSLPFEKIPEYLNISDIAFAIRDPKSSMMGVAPIKLGEYLLMDLPTIASAGIGDTDEILLSLSSCFIFDHKKNDSVERAVEFCINLKNTNSGIIRNFGVSFFLWKKVQRVI